MFTLHLLKGNQTSVIQVSSRMTYIVNYSCIYHMQSTNAVVYSVVNVLFFVLVLYHYPTRDLHRMLGLMEQGVTVFTIAQMIQIMCHIV